MEVIKTVDKELDEIWKEQEIPYDVKSEHNKLVIFARIQQYLSKVGFKTDNWLQESIKSWAEAYYRNAIKKVPKDDELVRLWFLYLYDLVPLISNKYYNPYEHNEKVVLFVEEVLNASHRSNAINYSYKYLMISNCLALLAKYPNNLLLLQKNKFFKHYSENLLQGT